VVRNRKATLNIDSLRSLQPKCGGTPPQMTIDLVQFSVGRLVYRDFALGSPLEKVFQLDINEKFADITDPCSLANAILARALTSANLEQLAGIDVDKLNSDLEKTVDSTHKGLQKFRDRIKGLVFPK